MAEETMVSIGRVSTFFAHPSVAIIELTAPLRIGETIAVKGHTTDFQHVVDSMEIDRRAIQEATAGQAVGVKVAQRCRKHDAVYRLAGAASGQSPVTSG